MATNTKPKPARLGRGLSSLMGHPPVSITPPSSSPSSPPSSPPPPPYPPTHSPTPTHPIPPAGSIATGEAESTTVTADLATIATHVHSLPTQATNARIAKQDAVRTPNPKETEREEAGRILFVPIEGIRPNPHQPRQIFDPASLQGLADSIRADGVMQPVILRPSSFLSLKKSHPGAFSSDQSQTDARHNSTDGPITFSASDRSGLEARIGREDGGDIAQAGGYELIAGERRWRAAQLAGLTHIPAIVRELDDRQSAQWALVENLQRQDLNPMERAHAFSRLAEQFSLSHEQIAQQVGVDRSTITNSLRLLTLSTDVQTWVTEGLLSNGHAKALAGMNDVHQQSALATQAIRAQWSVRRLELAVKNAASTTAAAPSPMMKTRQSHFQDLEDQIGQQLQTKVHLRSGRRKGAGALVIEFYTLEQFDALLARLDVKTEI